MVVFLFSIGVMCYLFHKKFNTETNVASLFELSRKQKAF